MRGWYRDAVERALTPTRVTSEGITEDQVDLYSYVPPPVENIPVYIDTFTADDSVPTEDDIEWAVI